MSAGLDLYQESIVAAARRVGDHPRLAQPDASATVDNPLCGDRITTDVTARHGALEQVGQRVRGCLLCEASAALLAELTTGCDAQGLAALERAVEALLAGEPWPHPEPRFEAFEMFAPVAGVPSRRRCVMLAFESLAMALRESRAPGPER